MDEGNGYNQTKSFVQLIGLLRTERSKQCKEIAYPSCIFELIGAWNLGLLESTAI